MAFEALNTYTDRLAKAYERSESIHTLSALADYYNTVLAMPKFKSQREYCKQTIYRLCPPYAQGYFETSKKQLREHRKTNSAPAEGSAAAGPAGH